MSAGPPARAQPREPSAAPPRAKTPILPPREISVLPTVTPSMPPPPPRRHANVRVSAVPPREVYVSRTTDEEPPKAAPWRKRPPRHFALTVAFYGPYGTGGGLRGRYRYFGLEAAVGYVPTFLIGEENKVHYFTTYQVSGAALIYFKDHNTRLQHGLRLAYAYSSMLLHGGFAGYAFEWSLWKHLALSFTVGLKVFPKGKEQVEKYAPDAKATWLNLVSIYFGVHVNFYLF
ncbi:MAG: hypothetical protein ABI333_25805 [bacterium]